MRTHLGNSPTPSTDFLDITLLTIDITITKVLEYTFRNRSQNLQMLGYFGSVLLINLFLQAPPPTPHPHPHPPLFAEMD